ncbi:MAG: CpaF family protein [Schwartzia sp.]|nr:CpaF family protein [Schwartzia sp. (in: firmicutes)]
MSALLERLGRPAGEAIRQRPIFAGRQSETTEDAYQELKLDIHRRIVDEMNAEEQQVLSGRDNSREQVEALITSYCNRVLDENPFAVPRGERARMVADICDEMLGLGPVEPLLKDETVTEVMINGPKQIFVERMGKLALTKVQFHDEAHLMNIIERILSPLGRRVDEASPLVDARLADGSRVNIIIQPLSLVGPCVTIRKFSKTPLSVENLISFGSMSEDMAEFLRACVKARLNVLVSGGTGSGKTTTLNVLSSFIPDDERIVTIEDAAELRLQQQHVVTLEARPANIEGKGEITIRDLVRNALRMRPDRIIVGEVRSGEALDMLQAMNTGHDGSLTTAHANSPRDALSRLETMVLMAGMELPVRAIREQVSSAIDLILQQSRIQDGSRKVTYITEVQKMEGDTIVLQDLFRYVQTSIDENGKSVGTFVSTGLQPSFLDKFRLHGVEVPESFFQEKQNVDYM